MFYLISQIMTMKSSSREKQQSNAYQSKEFLVIFTVKFDVISLFLTILHDYFYPLNSQTSIFYRLRTWCGAEDSALFPLL